MREIFDLLTGHDGRAGGSGGHGVPARDIDSAVRREVLAGLRCERKALPSKYFYDRRGTELFKAMTTASDYPWERLELSLLKACSGTIADLVGEGASLVDLGGCDAQKARVVLGALKSPLVYMPVDLSPQSLWSSAMQLQLDYPYLAVRPINADVSLLHTLPEDGPWVHDQVTFLYFGPTFCSYDPIAAVQLLRRIAGMAQRSLMIIGIDLQGDVPSMEAAYDDATGFTAEFNLNLLLRLNGELDGDFDLNGFAHVAYWNETCGRIEMHLKSRKRQTVHLAGEAVDFARGELVHTLSSYKYSIGQFHRLAQRAGYLPIKAWTDPDRRFSLHVLCKVDEACG